MSFISSSLTTISHTRCSESFSQKLTGTATPSQIFSQLLCHPPSGWAADATTWVGCFATDGPLKKKNVTLWLTFSNKWVFGVARGGISSAKHLSCSCSSKMYANLVKRLLFQQQLQDALIPHFKLKLPLDSFLYELHTPISRNPRRQMNTGYTTCSAQWREATTPRMTPAADQAIYP